MPATLERALADAGAPPHPDIPWRPAGALPGAGELSEALAQLEGEAAPATPRHAAACLARLTLAFEPNTRLSADAADLRLQVWLEACADLGDALWSEATRLSVQTLKWMPKPAEFRALVDASLARRAARLARCRQLLAMAEGRREEGARRLASRPERMRDVIRLYRKHGRSADAERVQRALETLEKRPAEPEGGPDAAQQP